jgi:hypothetical protein
MEFEAQRGSRFHSETCRKRAQRARRDLEKTGEVPQFRGQLTEADALTLLRLELARVEVEAVLAKARADGDPMTVLRAADRLLALQRHRLRLRGWRA